MSLESRIAQILKTQFGINLYQDTKKISDCILKMSDFYIRFPNRATPWSETWCQVAQLAYYLPLNYTRTSAALNRDGVTLDFIANLFDFGCGLSPISWYFYFNSNPQKPVAFYLLDQSPIPIELLRLMGLPIKQVLPSYEFQEVTQLPSTLTSCSYVLTEIQNQKDWRWLLGCQNVFILEPSTQMDSRRLMEFRSLLIKEGFFILAPCTHQKSCPLLIHSKTDWCHDRTSVEFAFLSEIEKHLPFYNRTVTFSYLVASRRCYPKPGSSPIARVIGDTLNEKGKTKQAICYNEERAFLTWLDRDWKTRKPEQIPRGSLIGLSSHGHTKGTPQNREFRVSPLS
jgi:hypothetical protein